ncbi:tyrosine-type recombinase/integrase [Bacillus sp. 1P06AnD]|uniref:tyrosine-type recombinase/integrase n=1 Tax=Bacillus sp. 1P06AnD TaxID=3132208 RepID=UPI0039A1E07E
MNDLVSKTDELLLQELKKQLSDTTAFESLQMKLDEAEKSREVPFADFSDVEIIQYYLYKQDHLNKQHDKSDRTRAEYKKELLFFIQHVLEFSNDIGIDIECIVDGSLFKSLEKRHIRKYQEWLATKSPYVLKKGPYSAATLSRKTTILRHFLKFLYETGYIKTPIHEGLKLATVRKDDRPNRDLGPKEVIELLTYYKKINHPVMFGLIHVLVTTGIRNEELCRLKIKDIHYDSSTSMYYFDILGKGNKRREAPIKDKVMDSIRAFRQARGLKEIKDAAPEEYLFTTSTGKGYSPSYLSQYITKMVKDSGLSIIADTKINISTHVFRHTFAIISYMSSADIYKISRSLGHEKLETTMIYLQKHMEREQHAIHTWEESNILGEFL